MINPKLERDFFMEEIDILYTINSKYIDIMLTSLLSVIKNSNCKKINCHLITSQFQLEDYHKIEAFLKKHSNVQIEYYPLENFDIEKFKIPNWRNSQIANARLFFQEILNQKLSKIKNLLYLDADTITCSDLTELKNYQKSLFAVKDLGFHKEAKQSFHLLNYYNSGVLWIDIEKWLQNNDQDRIIHFIENNKLPLVCPDQDILNLALKERIRPLPREYNVPEQFFIWNTFVEYLYFLYKGINIGEVQNAKKNPKILHFYGLSVKPWTEGNLNPFQQPFKELIKEVNPDFIKEPLSEEIQKFINSPKRYYNYLLTKKYVEMLSQKKRIRKK